MADCPTNCDACPTPITVIISGLSGMCEYDCAALNGSDTIPQTGFCTWQSWSFRSNYWALLQCSGDTWNLQIYSLWGFSFCASWSAPNTNDCPPKTGWTWAGGANCNAGTVTLDWAGGATTTTTLPAPPTTTTTTVAPTTSTTTHPGLPPATTTTLPGGTTTTTAPPGTTTTSACTVHPLDWSQLGLNAVEITYDFDKNTTELTVANTFFMLEGWSEIKRRLEEGQLSQRELDLSERIIDCQIVVGSQTPGTTITVEPEWTTTSTTTSTSSTSTTTQTFPPGWTTTTTTFTGTTTTTTAEEVTCSGCVPPLAHTYHVTLCGLGGDFEPYNGDHLVHWQNDCLWTGAGGKITLHYDAQDNDWTLWVKVGVGNSCVKSWIHGDVTGCQPTGSYAEVYCYDWTCSDPTTCADSAGATCEVSDTAGACPTTTTTTAACQDCRDLTDLCFSVDFMGASCLNLGPGPELLVGPGVSMLNFGEWYCVWRDDTGTVTGILKYHHSFGWRIEGSRAMPACKETYYKSTDRYNPCDPVGNYTEVLHGYTAVVAAAVCPTTTTQWETTTSTTTTTTTTTTFTGTTTTTTAGPTTTSTTEWPTTTTTVVPPTTTTTEAPVDCNMWCEPPLKHTYTVTLAGLVGAFAAYNGVHQMTHSTGCLWEDGALQMVLPGGTRWYVTLTLGGGCYHWWYSANDNACDPTGAYVFMDCQGYGPPCTGGDCGTPGSGTCSVS